MSLLINAAKEDSRPCLINADGIAAITFHEKSSHQNAHVCVTYVNGAIDRLTNYSKGDQFFDLEDIAEKLTAAGVDFLRDAGGALFFPKSAVYIKHCPNDGPNGSAQLSIGVSGFDGEMHVRGDALELQAAINKINAGRPFMSFDLDQTSYTNAANPDKVYVDISAIKMIRDQAYTVDIRFNTFRPGLSLHAVINAGVRDVPADASAAFKAALEKQKEAEIASLKPLAIELGRSCPQLLEVHASLDSIESILFVAPEKIARVEPFPTYPIINVTLKTTTPGYDGDLVQVDCGTVEAMQAALLKLTGGARANVRTAPKKPGLK